VDIYETFGTTNTHVDHILKMMVIKKQHLQALNPVMRQQRTKELHTSSGAWGVLSQHCDWQDTICVGKHILVLDNWDSLNLYAKS
jgi:hypothetical protein